MGWHHRPGDRVRLVYRKTRDPATFPYRGNEGTVRIRAGRGRGPKNFLVELDAGPVVVVPGGNQRGA